MVLFDVLKRFVLHIQSLLSTFENMNVTAKILVGLAATFYILDRVLLLVGFRAG